MVIFLIVVARRGDHLEPGDDGVRLILGVDEISRRAAEKIFGPPSEHLGHALLDGDDDRCSIPGQSG
jgi:hypothetical protein